MATKDITDWQVCLAYLIAKEVGFQKWPYELLNEWTGQPLKVCYRATERADRRGYIDCGISLRSGWLTEKGWELLRIGGPSHEYGWALVDAGRPVA